jgi:hypothetical protein
MGESMYDPYFLDLAVAVLLLGRMLSIPFG